MSTPESDSVQPVTFYVPVSSAEPIEVNVQHSGLRMVLVNRESMGLLDGSWKVLGLYFLLGAADDSQRYRAYVGEVGKSTLVQRVKQHESREWWSRALLIASASNQFNSAEIGWLEGRLYDVLNNAVACEVMNGNRPGDLSLPERERGVLERYVEPIMAALRACGASPDTADQKPVVAGRRTQTRIEGTVADLIEAGLLKPQTELHPFRARVTKRATVLADGRLQVGSQVYDSPSAAAKAAAGTTSEPGWDFWGAPSGAGGFVPLAELRARLTQAGQPSAAARKQWSHPRNVVSTESPLRALARRDPGRFPLKLEAAYRGATIEALVNGAGEIVYDGQAFSSPSAAGNAARLANGFAGPGKVATNGWAFWHYRDDAGELRELGDLRQHTDD